MKTLQNLKISFLFFSGSILIAVLLFLYSQISIAAPTITWTPSQVSETISPGESTIATVSFTSAKNLNNVVVRVVPELEPYIEVNPAVFSNIAKGQNYNLDLDISAPSDASFGIFDGTIQLRSGSGPKKTFAKPLPVTISIEPPELPPDPGEAGKATLEGIDSDDDGVRDDIQRYIALTYPDSAKTRAALTQITKAVQAALLNANDKEESIKYANEASRGVECLYFVRPNDARTRKDLLYAEILNTKERSIAFIGHNEQLGGEVFPIPRIDQFRSSCLFNPDLLEN